MANMNNIPLRAHHSPEDSNQPESPRPRNASIASVIRDRSPSNYLTPENRSYSPKRASSPGLESGTQIPGLKVLPATPSARASARSSSSQAQFASPRIGPHQYPLPPTPLQTPPIPKSQTTFYGQLGLQSQMSHPFQGHRHVSGPERSQNYNNRPAVLDQHNNNYYANGSIPAHLSQRPRGSYHHHQRYQSTSSIPTGGMSPVVNNHGNGEQMVRHVSSHSVSGRSVSGERYSGRSVRGGGGPGSDSLDDEGYIPYGEDDPGPIYPGQGIQGIQGMGMSSGVLASPQGFNGDPHVNLGGIIERAQGALSSLTLSIPSLQQLVDRYRTVTDQLNHYHQVIGEQETQISDLQAKEKQLDMLRKNVDQMSQMHSAEVNRLKCEIYDLKADVKKVKESVREKGLERTSVENTIEKQKEALMVEFENWKKGALDTHAAEVQCMLASHLDEKELLEKEHGGLMRALEETHTSKLKEIEELYETMLKVAEEAQETKLKEMEDIHTTEKTDISSAFASEKQLLEKEFTGRRQEMKNEFTMERLALEKTFAIEKLQIEAAFDARERDLEYVFATEKTALRANFEGEKLEMTTAFEAAKKAWDVEREEIIGGIHRSDEQSRNLEEDREILQGIRAALESEKASLEATVTTLEKENSVLESDKITLSGHVAQLEGIRLALEGENANLIEDGKKNKSQWNAEKQDLEKLVQGLQKENLKLLGIVKKLAEEEEGGEIRSRGDVFYIDAFTKLARDIVDISHEFSNLPIAPPSRVLAELPSGVPSMLGNSDSSRLIRQAYVQHIISKYLCYRIFQPFLFSLGKRYDKADSFFQAMSNQLREKSTRKEAVWRHYTLLAGYTASNAKKNAQVAASSVIEEITSHIKPFADQKKMDVIVSGITRVVKYAVETWRYARMERELITATMALDDSDPDLWLPHTYEKTLPYSDDLALVSMIRAIEAGRKAIIPLLPAFSREGTLPSLHRPTAVLDSGYVFSKGTALYTDCLPVVHRKKELDLTQQPSTPLDHQTAAKAEVPEVARNGRVEDHSALLPPPHEKEDIYNSDREAAEREDAAERERYANEAAAAAAAEEAERKAREAQIALELAEIAAELANGGRTPQPKGEAEAAAAVKQTNTQDVADSTIGIKKGTEEEEVGVKVGNETAPIETSRTEVKEEQEEEESRAGRMVAKHNKADEKAAEDEEGTETPRRRPNDEVAAETDQEDGHGNQGVKLDEDNEKEEESKENETLVDDATAESACDDEGVKLSEEEEGEEQEEDSDSDSDSDAESGHGVAEGEYEDEVNIEVENPEYEGSTVESELATPKGLGKQKEEEKNHDKPSVEDQKPTVPKNTTTTVEEPSPSVKSTTPPATSENKLSILAAVKTLSAR